MYTRQIKQESEGEDRFGAMQEWWSVITAGIEQKGLVFNSRITEPLRFPLSGDRKNRKNDYSKTIEYLTDNDNFMDGEDLFICEIMVRRGKGLEGGKGRNRSWGVRKFNPGGGWRGSPLELIEDMAGFSPDTKDYIKVKFRGNTEGSRKAVISFTEYEGDIIGYLMRVPSEYEDDFGLPKRERAYSWNNGIWVPGDWEDLQPHQLR